MTDAGQIEVAAFSLIGQQRSIVAGNRIEERGPISLDVGENSLRRRTNRRKDGSGAGGERKIAGIPQPVCEEQSGDAVAAVIFADPQNSFGIVLGRKDDVMMQMYTALGRPRASRRVQPKSGIVFGSIRRSQLGGRILYLIKTNAALRSPAHDNHLVCRAAQFSVLQPNIFQQGLPNDRHPCFRILHNVLVVSRAQESADRDSNCSYFDGSKKAV